MDFKIILAVFFAFFITQDAECKPQIPGSDTGFDLINSRKPLSGYYKGVWPFGVLVYNVPKACIDSTLQKLPEKIKTVAEEGFQSMIQYASGRAMDRLWSLREEILRKVIEERTKKLQMYSQRLTDRVNLWKSELYRTLKRSEKFKFIKIIKDDIRESIDDVKNMLERGKPESVLEKMMNYNDLLTSAEVNKCATELIFKSDESCIKDMKTSFEKVVAEMEKLLNATNFKIEFTREEEEDLEKPTETKCDKCYPIERNFDILMQEADKNSVFTEFLHLLYNMRAAGAFANLIAEELSKMPNLNCNQLKNPPPPTPAPPSEPSFNWDVFGNLPGGK